MSKVDDMIQNMKAFHALPETLPEVSVAEWRKRCADWKSRMSIWIRVGELRSLLDRLEAAESKLQTFQRAETMIPPPPPAVSMTAPRALEVHARESWADWYCTVPQTEDNFLDLDTDETLARHEGDEDE